MELVDKAFYQLSYDSDLVAIIADYPGLLPASHVSKTGVPTSKKDPFFLHFTYRTHMVSYREGPRDAKPNPQ